METESELKKLITDEQLDSVWGSANFGDGLTKREVIKGALLKCASGYYTGHTAKQILGELKLVTTKWTLTKLGQRYLFQAFYDGTDI